MTKNWPSPGSAMKRPVGRVKQLLAIGLAIATVLAAPCLPLHAANDNLVYTPEDLQRYVDKWKVKDGDAAFVISDYFCLFAIAEPADFLRLTTHAGVFDDWLANLSNLSFGDSGEDCLNRDCLRHRMMSALRLVGRVKDSKVEAARERLIDALGRIRVHPA